MFSKKFIFINLIFTLLMLFGNQSYAHYTISFQARVILDSAPENISEPTLEKCEIEINNYLSIGAVVVQECEVNVHSHEGIPSGAPDNTSNFPLPFPRPDPCTSCPPFSLDLDHRIIERWGQVVNPVQLDRVRELNDKYNINSYNEEIFDLQQQYNLEGYAKELHDMQQNIDRNGLKNKKLK